MWIASRDPGEASTSPAVLDDHVDADQQPPAALEWALWANDLNDIVYLDDDDGLTPLCWPQFTPHGRCLRSRPDPAGSRCGA